MEHRNLVIIEQFFEAVKTRDMAKLHVLVSQDVTWSFPGNHPFAGVHLGIEGILKFFDAMILLNFSYETLVVGVNDRYVVQAYHVSRSETGITDFEGEWCILWEFADGRIYSGKHLVAGLQEENNFFNKIS